MVAELLGSFLMPAAGHSLHNAQHRLICLDRTDMDALAVFPRI
jgi:hypothetical protein